MPDAALVRERGGQRVDDLEATVAHVAEAPQAVGEDFVHRLGRALDEFQAELPDDAPDVGLRTLGDVSVVEREDQRTKAEVDEPAQRVGAVLAAAEQHHRIVAAARLGLDRFDFPAQFVERAEVRACLFALAVVFAADAADSGVVDMRVRVLRGQPAARAVARRRVDCGLGARADR